MAGRRIRCPNCRSIQRVPRVEASEQKSAIHNEVEAFAFLFAEHDQKRKHPQQRQPAEPRKENRSPKKPTPGGDRGRAVRVPQPVPPQPEEDDINWETVPPMEESDLDSGIDLSQETPFAGGPESIPSRAVFLGGLIVVGLAVVWFLGGLAAGLIFYYPPVLLILGVIALVVGSNQRGLRGEEPRVATGKGG
jgi:hypothetical protein